MGDSTFFHAGVPALIDAVNQDVRFVLVILDNSTTAMTGSQPTPATGKSATGGDLVKVEMQALIEGCGIQFCKTGRPYDSASFIALLKEAVAYSRNSGPAVVIAKHPCIIDASRKGAVQERIDVEVTDDCDACGYCHQHFECPALILKNDDGRTAVDQLVCNGCGVCLNICPKNAIAEKVTE